MSRDATLKRILEGGIVAVVRAESGERLAAVVRALAEGGVTAAEITFTVPDAIGVIRKVREELGDSIVLGAGTVLDPETARAALLAGAEYIVAPTVNLDVIRMCRRYDKVVMPGALTPTEVVAAWEAGADVVKIFPADLGGPAYLKALRGPPAPDPDDADRRGRPRDRRGLPQGGRVLPGRGGISGRADGRRLGRLRPVDGAGGSVRRHRPRLAGSRGLNPGRNRMRGRCGRRSRPIG